MRRPPIVAIVLLLLAGFFWLGMMGSLSDYPDSDAAGRGMAVAFGALFGIALWLALVGLTIAAAVRGWIGGWTAVWAVVLLLLAPTGAWQAAQLYGLRVHWALAITTLLPVLVAAYALWPRLPLAGLVVVLSAVPFAAALLGAGQVSPQELARQEQLRLEEEAARRRRADDFARLGPDSSLADYLPFVAGDYSGAARDGMRKVKTRQADAVALLNSGHLGELAGLLEIDVDATPELCQAYGNALGKAAAEVDPKARTDYLGAAMALERQRPNLEWLTGDGCDLRTPLGLLEKNVRAVANSQRMTGFADVLAKLRSR